MESAPINKIEKAHQLYRDGRYAEALGFYTEALSMAKTKPQKIALHSNRAACYLKLHHFKKAAEECTSVLELDHKHTGALMLRAQTLVTLKEYHSALFDVNRLIELNPSSEVYQNLQACLKTQLFTAKRQGVIARCNGTVQVSLCTIMPKSLAPIPEAEAELEEEDEDRDEAESGPEAKEVKEEEQVEEEGEGEKNAVVGRNQNAEFEAATPNTEVTPTHTLDPSQKVEKSITTLKTQSLKESSEQHSSGWKTIPKPKGHSHLDYSRWDRVEDDSSEDDDDEDDEGFQPKYRFRVRTVGVRSVK